MEESFEKSSNHVHSINYLQNYDFTLHEESHNHSHSIPIGLIEKNKNGDEKCTR